jgi:hypothetical protein
MSTTHHYQGARVKSTEQAAKSVSTPKTGLFATLRALLPNQGSGASENSRRGGGVVSVRRSGRTFHPLSRLKCCVPALLCAAAAGLLAFAAAPALAAAGPPEIEEEWSAKVSATGAQLWA